MCNYALTIIVLHYVTPTSNILQNTIFFKFNKIKSNNKFYAEIYFTKIYTYTLLNNDYNSTKKNQHFFEKPYAGCRKIKILNYDATQL